MNVQKIMQGVGFGLVYLGVLIDIVIGEFTTLPAWLNEVANILCIFGAGLATGTIPNRVETIIENGGDKNAMTFQDSTTNATNTINNEVITPNTETTETTLTAENTTQSEKRAF